MMILFGVGDPRRQNIKSLLPSETEAVILSRAEEVASASTDLPDSLKPALPAFWSQNDSLDFMASLIKVIIRTMVSQ